MKVLSIIILSIMAIIFVLYFCDYFVYLKRVKYAENKTNLPSDMIEIVIEGGCHAYFGMYGPQEGDGNPTISNEEQIVITASHIASMMN